MNAPGTLRHSRTHRAVQRAAQRAAQAQRERMRRYEQDAMSRLAMLRHLASNPDSPIKQMVDLTNELAVNPWYSIEANRQRTTLLFKEPIQFQAGDTLETHGTKGYRITKGKK